MKQGPVAIAFLLYAAPISAQSAPPEDSPTPNVGALAGIPDLTFTWYDVTGKSADAIRASMNRLRPSDANDGTRVDALSETQVKWRWMTRGGICDPSTVVVTVTGRTTLPRLATDVSRGVRAQWDKYLAALEVHEAGHLRYVYDQIPELQTTMRATSCDKLQETATATLAAFKKHDMDYDRVTGHGRTQGAVFP